MKTTFILAFILLLLSFHSNAQQTIDKLNVNQLKLPKESSNKALILDGAGQVKSSSTITDTELGYLEGLTDTLVNLLSGKANDADVVKLSGNQSINGVKTFEGKLVASSTVNGSIPCPVMTEVQRDAFTPIEGDCVYNSDTLKLNVFDGSVWKDVGGAGGISLWLTANPYNVNDIIIESDKIYRCLIAHTSGTFATDLAASKWIEVSSGLQSPVALADGGTGVAITPTAGSIVYVDADSFEQVSGTAGQILQSNGSGAPTFVNKSISAKSLYGSSVTAEEIQVPNNLLTQVDTNKHLNETGNKSILINPSFEHSTFSTGWTNSAGTFSQETSIVIDGKASAKLVLSSETMSLSQSSTLYQAQFADGVQGLASVRVKSDIALKVCSIQAGTVSTTNCVDVQANNKWGLYKVPMILEATSNGISIASTGSVSGTVYIDDAFVGAVDLQATVDASKIAGEAYFAGTTNCTWSRTSATVGAFTSDADCPGPTVSYSSLGSWQTTDSDLPRVTVNNLPAGVYKAKFLIGTYSGAGNNNTVSIYDGSTICTATVVNGATSLGGGIAECLFTYTSSGNRTFELYGASASSTINISMSASGLNVKFILEYFGSSSVYSSTNADTDWASCGLTGSAFTGFGSSVPTPALQCKRQGGDLLIKGTFTAGTTPTAVEARLALPTWNGVQLVSAGSSIIPSLQFAGNLVANIASTTFFGDYLLIEPSVSYLTFSQQSSTTNGITKANGNAIATSGLLFSVNARIPIEGWQNSNILIGQFSGLESCTSTLDCTDTFSAAVSSAGVVSKENVDWLNGNCSVSGTSTYTCNFNSSIFAVAPNCVFISNSGANINLFQNIPTTASSVQARSQNNSNIDTAQGFDIICQKQGVDYIGKTAKAVASDQNVRTPGVTNAVLMSAKVDGSAVVTNQKGNFISSCTGTTTRTCTFTSSFLSEPNCLVNCNLNAGGCVSARITTQSSSSVSFETYSTTAVTSNPVILSCHGERQ